MSNKKIERICSNCRLFDGLNRLCTVVILINEKKINIPVDAEDPCFFEQEFVAKHEVAFADGKKIVEEKFTPADELQQVRLWVEDPKTGEKTDKDGIVKIEYPEGFFGKKD